MEDRRIAEPQKRKRLYMRDDHGLSLVMGEIADLMGAAGAYLIMFPAKGEHPSILYCDVALGEDCSRMVLDMCLAVRADFEDGLLFWRSGAAGSGRCVLFLPVEQTAGHSRLVITVVFDHPSAETRSRAEVLYVERRPFAIGYFHLWQANRAMVQRARSLEAVLDHMAIGVLLLDRSSRIVHANRTGEEILSAGDGLSRSNGQPRATSLSDGVNLQAALSHALVAAQHQQYPAILHTPLISFGRRLGPPLIAALLPSNDPSQQPDDVAAIMYIVDPALDTVAMLKPLCGLYQLSAVETVLATHLAGGKTITDAATSMRIKAQTARSYLKSIFIKTNTNRQTELVALLLSSVIRMKNDAAQEAMSSSYAKTALRKFE